MVDILVGWHIDTQQDESLIKFIGGNYFPSNCTQLMYMYMYIHVHVYTCSAVTTYIVYLLPCVDALITLEQFWIEDIPFSVDLLKQFLEDMEHTAM